MLKRLLLIGTMGAVLLGVAVTSGCKKGSEAAVSPVQNPSAGAVSPVGNDDEYADDTDDPGAAAAAPARRPTRRAGEKDWRKEDDEKPKKQAPVAGRRVVPAKAGAAKKKEPDETPEEKAKRLAREATLKSVDGALRGASASMKRCYDQSKAKAGSATLSFRVHRSGYVMSPSVSGVDPKVRSCIEGVLKRLRVSGVKTPSLNVTRTLRFRRY